MHQILIPVTTLLIISSCHPSPGPETPQTREMEEYEEPINREEFSPSPEDQRLLDKAQREELAE